MTSALHRLPGMDDFRSRLQLAELEYVVRSPAAATSLAENYVGFPLPCASHGATCPQPAIAHNPVESGIVL
jgi:p-hydroxybenzoate 3-monooxygenase